MKKRVLILLFCVSALLLTLAACQAEPPVDEPTETPQGTQSPLPSTDEGETASLPTALTLPLLDNITLDPVNCPDGVQQTVGALVYQGLFALDENFNVRNVLCESYSYNAAKRTYRFTLKEGVTFSNGSKLRASDVLSTYQRAAESARYGARFANVSSMRVSSGELVITLTRDDAAFPALLDIPIVRAGSENKTFPLGTGDYVPTQDEDGTLYLQRREDAEPRGELPERIELYAVKDNAAAAYRFSTGDVNLLVSDLTGLSAADASGNVARADADTTTMLYLGFNFSDEALSQSALRSAMSAALDRDEAAQRIYAGHARAAQFAVSPADALYPTALEDRGEADYAATVASLLAGETIELTLLVNEENSFKVSLAQWVCAQLSCETLTLTPRVLAWEDYLAALESGDFELYLGEVKLGANWDIGALLRERAVTVLESESEEGEADEESELLVSGGTLNYGGYYNATAETLLDAYLAAPDEAHMNSLCAQVQRTVPFAPLLFKTVTLLTPMGFLEISENAVPTATDPFAHAEDWTLHFAQE